MPFEGAGLISEWMAARGYAFERIALWDGDALPDPASLDLLVIMGGPMNVDEESAYPWLQAEKRWLQSVLAGDVRVLGVCLGAQLIARALGARVFRGPVQEVGWFPVTRVAGVRHHTFELPAGAVHLASSALYAQQAFAVGDRVVGLQCHLETTPASAQDIIDHTDFTPGPTIQSAEAMMADPARFAALRPILFDLLDRLSAC